MAVVYKLPRFGQRTELALCLCFSGFLGFGTLCFVAVCNNIRGGVRRLNGSSAPLLGARIR